MYRTATNFTVRSNTMCCTLSGSAI